MDAPEDEPPAGALPLAEAIDSLREQLASLWQQPGRSPIRFKPTAVELTLQTALTRRADASAKARWWVLEVGAGGSVESASIQTIKLTLEPVFFADGERVDEDESLISAER
ncbi:trypco2 family protein [Microbacterium sp. BWT-B31]|uniref:trypco2 family protein n=1 Tax=Microbacterium sp. BWT-B31 TaxID=3232072 RepID=UPI003529B24B